MEEAQRREINIRVIGEQAQRFCGMVTAINSRNICNMLGISRTSHTLVSDNLWISLNFYCMEEFLLDQSLQLSYPPFVSTIVTYTHDSDESMKHAELLARRDGIAQARKEKHNQPLAPSLLLVAVDTNLLGEKGSNLYKLPQHVRLLNRADISSIKNIYRWILEACLPQGLLNSTEKECLLASLTPAKISPKTRSSCTIS